MFLCDNQWKFWTFSKFERFKRFFWKTKIFSKKLEDRFLVESTKIEKHHFHTKLPYQKPMLRQIEWWVQNGPITKNGILLVTTLFFWKFDFSLWTSYKVLLWCTNHPNAHIRTFCKRWNFILRCFFPLSILNPFASCTPLDRW